LITCFDKIGDKEGAVRQLLEAVELSRRDMKLFVQLGTRLADLQRKADAERAFTSTVEMLPNESESHTMLAEIYEKENRYPEAIDQWERVVQIRLLEPTGLLKLAAAQIHEKQWMNAKETLRKLRSQSWPARFNDVQQQSRDLERQLEEQSKKQ
jgi:tetratricopeptide (TPR) repeat protein